MAEVNHNNYFFLNREGTWPGFQTAGLELCEDGSLQLCSLPLLSGSLPDAVKAAPVPDGPAGLAIDATGTIYFSGPDNDRIERILSCDGAMAPLPCVGGTGSQVMRFNTPRGLLIPKTRPCIFVCDSDNHRIQIFDLNNFQLVEIWGQSGFSGSPQPGSQPGQFNTPWTLAGDSLGNVYVLDYGNQRVQKFNSIGDVMPSFCANVQNSGKVPNPLDVAVWERNGAIWIVVLDNSAQIYIFDSNGKPVIGPAGTPLSFTGPPLVGLMGVAASGDRLYVGDNSARRVFQFRLSDNLEYLGEAIGYNGPVASLVVDSDDGLWVHPGGSLTPVKLEATQGYAPSGTLWPLAPVQVTNHEVNWHRLQALGRHLDSAAHLQIYAYPSNDSTPPVFDPAADDPFADPTWQSVSYISGVDITDLYIGIPKNQCQLIKRPTSSYPANYDLQKLKRAKYLWVGAQFSGNGTASPLLRQLRAEFDYPTYDQYLPAIYRNTENCDEFLLRLLSLFESLYGGIEHEIRSLPALFDPKASPKRFLAWLAGCVGLQLDDNWDEKLQRKIVAEIFRLSGLRGTARGLRETVKLFTGANLIIEEPLLNAAWWSLPSGPDSCCASCSETTASGVDWESTQNSILGATTMLASAQPQGAVVGTSAVLDQSHLITGEDFGSPLFSDVAFQFSALVYRSEVTCVDALARVRAVLDQEKPAHTAYHLCIIDPHFRVGFQSRVGIDTVVAGPPRSMAVGTGQALGLDAALAGPSPSVLGADSRLGVSARLG